MKITSETLLSFYHRRSHQIVFLLILLTALVLRVYQLDDLPNGFFSDEASIGYNAYTISENGRDEHGHAFPVLFQAFGEYKNSIHIYTAAVFVKILGPSNFSVRLASALYGTLIVIAAYLIGRQLFGRQAAIFSMLLAAFSPWGFHLSRVAFELISLPFFVGMGCYFLFKGLERPKYFIWAAVFLSLSFYTYAIAKAYVPIVGLIFFIFYFKKVLANKTIFAVSIVVGLVLLAPMINETIKGHANARYSVTSIFSDRSLNYIKKEIAKSEFIQTTSLKKLADNEKFVAAYGITRMFLAHYNPELLLEGDKNPRHSTQGFGVVYKVELILIVLGLGLLLYARKKNALFLFIIFLLYPLPVSLTHTALNYSATRGINALPFIHVVGGYALAFLYSLAFSKSFPTDNLARALRVGVISIFTTTMVWYAISAKKYFVHYFTEFQHQDRAFQSGFEEVLRFVDTNEDIKTFSFYRGQFDDYIFVLFYVQHDPVEWQKNKSLSKYIKTNKAISKRDNVDLDSHVYIVRHRKYFRRDSIKDVKDTRGRVIFQVIPANKFP